MATHWSDGLLTAEDVAATLGITVGRVRTIARRRNATEGRIGWKRPGYGWLFMPHEVKKLKPGPTGVHRQHREKRGRRDG